MPPPLHRRPGWAVAAKTARAKSPHCKPRRDRLWLLSTAHKTGTTLTKKVVESILAPERIHAVHGWNVPSATNVTIGALRTNHPGGAGEEPRRRVETLAAWARPRILRAVVFVRDPLEIILSAYFYHRTTTERWVRVGMQRGFRHPFEAFCAKKHGDRRGRHIGESASAAVDDASRAACALLWYRSHNATYQETLTALDMPVGLAIEGLRDLESFRRINNSIRVLRDAPHVARIYDLDAVTANTAAFDAAFTAIFDFLGAAHIRDCVRRASHHDVHRYPSTTHGHHPANTAATRDVARRALPRAPWFAYYVQPYRLSLGYGAT